MEKISVNKARPRQPVELEHDKVLSTLNSIHSDIKELYEEFMSMYPDFMNLNRPDNEVFSKSEDYTLYFTRVDSIRKILLDSMNRIKLCEKFAESIPKYKIDKVDKSYEIKVSKAAPAKQTKKDIVALSRKLLRFVRGFDNDAYRTSVTINGKVLKLKAVFNRYGTPSARRSWNGHVAKLRKTWPEIQTTSAELIETLEKILVDLGVKPK